MLSRHSRLETHTVYYFSIFIRPKILGPRSRIGRIAPLEVRRGTKNPIRVREINNIVILLTLVLVPPHSCRGATATLKLAGSRLNIFDHFIAAASSTL